MRRITLGLVLLLTGCVAPLKDFPQTCHVRVPDPDGRGGYTTSYLPCRLMHTDVPPTPPPSTTP